MSVKFFAQAAGAKPKTGDEWTTVSDDSGSLSRKDRRRITRLDDAQKESLPDGAVTAKLPRFQSSKSKDSQTQRTVEVGGINSSQTTSATAPLLASASSSSSTERKQQPTSSYYSSYKRREGADSSNWRDSSHSHSHSHSRGAHSTDWRNKSSQSGSRADSSNWRKPSDESDVSES